MRTGVFFHPIFSQKSWPVMGDKFKGFPGIMADSLKLPGVELIEPQMVAEELLLKVHDQKYIQQVKKQWYYEGAALSVGGCVEATERVWRGKSDNALVFNVAAGHHAGPVSAWGGTYISDTGPAVANLENKFGLVKVAILDTDSHHGDGTRAMVEGKMNILHVCFCSQNSSLEQGTKIDVDVGWHTDDTAYLNKVRQTFFPLVESFKPGVILHLLGHDTCQGDYGDRGLSMDIFPWLVKEVKDVAQRVCSGKYIVATLGGARADVAEYIFPQIIRLLATEEK